MIVSRDSAVSGTTRASGANRAPRARSVVLAVGAIAMLGMLAGCVNGEPAPGQSTAPPTTAASASPTQTPIPSPTPTPTGTPATPITADCASIVPLQALYDLDSNLALLDESVPSSPLAAEAVAAGGIACTLIHASNSSTIVIAVSAPGSVALDAARSAAGDPIDLGVAGADGFASGAGVQAFTATQRFTAESSFYPAEQLVAAIAIPLGALG